MKNEHAWNDLRDTLFHSKMYYQCWWYLAGAHEDRDFRLSAVGQEWLFFAAAESAFWESLISRLASIFDESPKSISFGSLDDLARHSTFKKNWDRGRLLYKYRSKVVAHRDSIVARKGNGYGFGLCFDDVKLILDDSCLIYCECADAIGLCGVPDVSCGEDLRAILIKLASNVERNGAIG